MSGQERIAFSDTGRIELENVAIRLGSGLTLQLSGLAPDATAVGLLAGITTLGLTLKVPSLLNAHIDDGMGAARQLAVRAAGRLLPGP